MLKFNPAPRTPDLLRSILHFLILGCLRPLWILQEHELLDGAVVQAARRLEPKIGNQVIIDQCVYLLDVSVRS